MAGFMLWENALRGATIVSEQTLTSFGASNMTDGKTSSQAGFSGGQVSSVVFDLATATTIDTMCVGRHNGIDSTSMFVKLYGSDDNASYTYLDFFVSLNSRTKFNYYLSSTSKTYRYYKVEVTTLGNNIDAYIADISIGERLDLERSQKHGFTPPEFSDGDHIIPNVTRGRNLAGLTVKQGLKRVKFDFFYYHQSFFTRWLEFTESVKRYPCYILWNDVETLFYCWPTKKIPEPSYAKKIQDYFNVKLDMMGLIE